MSYCPTCRGTFEEGQFCPRDGARLVPRGPLHVVPTDSTGGAPTGLTAREGGAGSPARASGPDPLLGQVVADRFRIVRRIGSGGMGTVYEAEHAYIKKRVALKLLRAEVVANPESVTRFQREALAASTIGHENIVTIDDFGRLADGQVYLTMEFLDGLPLDEVIAQGPVELNLLLDVALQTCHGLAAAHAKGIVHRDMKPENVFLVEGGTRVKILDFGIAKVMRADDNANLTKTGAVFGTPNYMAPEQALGQRVDHRADVYSLGVILFQLATGRLPFVSDSFLAILTKHVTEAPPRPRDVAPERYIPEALEALILKAMAKEPAARFADMREMVAALLELRRAVLGDAPLRSQLRLSRVQPPAPAADLDEAPLPPVPGKVTATAGELLRPSAAPPRRAGLLLGLAAAALLLVAGTVTTVYVLRKGPGPEARPAGGPTLVGAQLAGGASGKGAGIPTAAPRPPVAPEPKKAAPQRVTVVVVSEPLRATVERDGKVIGKTPLKIEELPGVTFKVLLRLPGYQPQAVEVLADMGEVTTVPLAKLGAGAKSKKVRVRIKSGAKKQRRPRGSGGEDSHDPGGGGDDPLNPY